MQESSSAWWLTSNPSTSAKPRFAPRRIFDDSNRKLTAEAMKWRLMANAALSGVGAMDPMVAYTTMPLYDLASGWDASNSTASLMNSSSGMACSLVS